MDLGAANLVVVVHAVRPSCLGLASAVAVRPLDLCIAFNHLHRRLDFVVPGDNISIFDGPWLDLEADNLFAFATRNLVKEDLNVQMVVDDVLSLVFVVVADWDAFRIESLKSAIMAVSDFDSSRESI